LCCTFYEIWKTKNLRSSGAHIVHLIGNIKDVAVNLNNIGKNSVPAAWDYS
jgi:hypothetical protein